MTAREPLPLEAAAEVQNSGEATADHGGVASSGVMGDVHIEHHHYPVAPPSPVWPMVGTAPPDPGTMIAVAQSETIQAQRQLIDAQNNLHQAQQELRDGERARDGLIRAVWLLHLARDRTSQLIEQIINERDEATRRVELNTDALQKTRRQLAAAISARRRVERQLERAQTDRSRAVDLVRQASHKVQMMLSRLHELGGTGSVTNLDVTKIPREADLDADVRRLHTGLEMMDQWLDGQDEELISLEFAIAGMSSTEDMRPSRPAAEPVIPEIPLTGVRGSQSAAAREPRRGRTATNTSPGNGQASLSRDARQSGHRYVPSRITARGAWEGVKRHFRELGIDTQTEEFTVAGIGNMSRDVFGNGMLLSSHIRLLAAFDHQHVFVDPAPDTAVSFAERHRLFELSQSSWDDYDRSLISEGGGVWPRTAQSIALSPQLILALGLPKGIARLAPTELIKAILQAPVDLLWNGGSGTYVKATDESHTEIGDTANDTIRINSADLRARVIGEGGTLGLTQLGRIEFARAGGKVNTDVLDTSAGVDCSDHEENIKLLLDQLVQDGRLSKEQRTVLLAEMADEIADLVLANNYAQNTVLGVSRAHAVPMLSVHSRLIATLEANEGLDRDLENLPSSQECTKMGQDGEGLTSPDLATLLTHVKAAVNKEILASDLPNGTAFMGKLIDYFPSLLREQFGDAILTHPQRHKINTVLLANEVVSRGGLTYVHRLMEDAAASTTDAVRAFTVVTAVYDLAALWQEIEALDNVVPTEAQDHMVLQTRRLLDRASRWLLSNRPRPLAVGAEIRRFSAVVRQLAPTVIDQLPDRTKESAAEAAQRLVDGGVPERLAARVSTLLDMYTLLDITEVAELAEREVGLDMERSPQETAELYWALRHRLGIDELMVAVDALDRGDLPTGMARMALRDDLYSALRAVTLDALQHSDPEQTTERKLANWEQASRNRLDRVMALHADVPYTAGRDLATLTVLTHQFSSLAR